MDNEEDCGHVIRAGNSWRHRDNDDVRDNLHQDPENAGGDHMADTASLKEILFRHSAEQCKVYQDIARRIKKLRSRNEDDVLFYRYIKGMEWYEIAETMSYSERQIHRIHGKALAHLELPEKDVSECQ